MRPFILFITTIFILSSCKNDDNKWSVQSFPEGNFSINIMSPVTKSKKTEMTAFGKQERFFVRWKPSSLTIDKFKLFEVSYTQCPASIAADSTMCSIMLDSAVEMRKKDFSEVEVIESQEIALNGYPGRAFFYDDAKGNTLVSIKMCIAGDKLYDLVVIAKKNYSTNDDIGKFFDSFQLLK